MSELWVVNASPIITLAKAGYLHLLSDLAPEFQVPEVVARELLAGRPEDPARQALESGWGPRAPVGSIPAQILEWGLGQGESAVLTVAKERTQSVAVLDDAAARRCARTLLHEAATTRFVCPRSVVVSTGLARALCNESTTVGVSSGFRASRTRRFPWVICPSARSLAAIAARVRFSASRPPLRAPVDE